jgi:hypothetical protein
MNVIKLGFQHTDIIHLQNSDGDHLQDVNIVVSY